MQVESNVMSVSYESLRIPSDAEFNESLRRNRSINADEQTRYYVVKTKKIEFNDIYIDSAGTDSSTFLHIFTDRTTLEQLKTEKANRDYQRLMLFSVAHEFRNPLNSISGSLELIELVAIKEQVKKFAKAARNSCFMLNSYVDDILDLGRIEGGGFQLNPTKFKVSCKIQNF